MNLIWLLRFFKAAPTELLSENLRHIPDSSSEITKLESKIEAINTDTLEAVIRGMQKGQPQVSPDTALQMQLIASCMQNPDGFMKLLELSEKLPQKK